MQVFDFTPGDAPLLVSVPHAGTGLPPAVADALRPAGQRLQDTDWFVDRLMDFAAGLGASVLVARLSRAVVDLNRPPDDAALYPGQAGTGLVPETFFDGTPLWSTPVSAEARQDRLDRYWRPYHVQLAAELDRLRRAYGRVVLWDAHSIRRVPRLFDGRFPELNPGTFPGELRLWLAGPAGGRARGERPPLGGQWALQGGYITGPARRRGCTPSRWSRRRPPTWWRPPRADCRRRAPPRSSHAAAAPGDRHRLGAAWLSSVVRADGAAAGGWAADVVLTIGEDGALVSVEVGAAPGGAARLPGPVVPGMPNLHSHAFQRAMAGTAEHRSSAAAETTAGPGGRRYRLLAALGPDELQAVAAWLYVECLEGGFTSVGEFHYVHHDVDGQAYADPAELSRRVVAAARAAGIGLTHLPVLYMAGGIGQPPTAGQRRFLWDPAGLLALVEALRQEAAGDPLLEVGIAPHSLRAVPLERMAALVADLDAVAPRRSTSTWRNRWRRSRPCARPASARCRRCSTRWALTPAGASSTPPTSTRRSRRAARRRRHGPVPVGGASLGDGLFPAVAHIGAGALSASGRTRTCAETPPKSFGLELGQRLRHRRRVLLLPPGARHVGSALWAAAARGGAQALGQAVGALRPGARADRGPRWCPPRPDRPRGSSPARPACLRRGEGSSTRWGRGASPGHPRPPRAPGAAGSGLRRRPAAPAVDPGGSARGAGGPRYPRRLAPDHG